MSETILGVKELEEKFKKLSETDYRIAMGQAIGQVQASAKALAPVKQGGGGGELRESIKIDVTGSKDDMKGICYTNKEYAEYVEFGTGPKGQESHGGISPDLSPSYATEGWWMHESQVDPYDAEMYHWFKIDTEDGVFYRTEGQPAQPYMYPALKDNEDIIIDIFEEALKRVLK